MNLGLIVIVVALFVFSGVSVALGLRSLLRFNKSRPKGDS